MMSQEKQTPARPEPAIPFGEPVTADGQMTPAQLRALQLKSLELALYFKDFCQRNNLLFYFCGGCCIGAVRHGGFIPWDDDVDVFMPREDYEKMKRLWNQQADTARYVLECSDEHKVNHELFVTIRDAETTFIKPYQTHLDMCHGVLLDILPLDGYPSSKMKRRMQVFWALLYSLYCSQVVPEKHGGSMRVLSKIALGMVPSKKMRYRIWKMAERKMTRYRIEDCDSITELCAGPGYMKNRYPKSAFQSAVYKDFEGEQMPLPVGYDDYLRIAFGDYMQLPPKEKQVAHHDAVLIDLDHSYKTYKGKYYCTTEADK